MGETGFPHAPVPQGNGETGFPPTPARRRVWEGVALTQGDGATGLPHSSTRWEGVGGRSPPKNNRMFIAVLCGGAAWTSGVNTGPAREAPGAPV